MYQCIRERYTSRHSWAANRGQRSLTWYLAGGGKGVRKSVFRCKGGYDAGVGGAASKKITDVFGSGNPQETGLLIRTHRLC